MRILTTVLMLCLPMTAMGEVYACRTESNSFLSNEIRGVLTSTEADLTDYLVDTESGYRNLENGSVFKGECHIPGPLYEFISCTWVSPFSVEQFYIDLDDLTFSYSNHNRGRVQSYFGKCTEI